MIYPPPQVILALLILSTAVVLIGDIRYNPFCEDQDGILKRYIKGQLKKSNLFEAIDSQLFEFILVSF